MSGSLNDILPAPLRELILTFLICGLWVSPAGAADDENWPGWRGNGNGTTHEKNLPLRWDAKTNIAWKIPLNGQGVSSPIVWSDRIFLTASAEKGNKRYIICIGITDGKIIWEKELQSDRKTETYPKTGYAAPTPATDGKRVYAFFDSPGLVAVDIEGKNVLWKKDFGPYKAYYNMASSPVICDDMVVLVCDVSNDSFIVAVDGATGDVRWKVPRKTGCNSSSPLVITVGDTKQIVVNSQTVIAYRPKDGKELWSCRGMKPYVTPTAIFDGNLVYATSGRSGPTIAIDPRGTGDVTDTQVRMYLPSGGPYVPSPVICSYLFLPNDDGVFRFVDPAGKVVFKDRIRARFSASPIADGEKIYWTSEKGDTYVIDTSRVRISSPKTKVIAVNSLGESVLASPAVSNGRMLIRTGKHLFCIAGAELSTAEATSVAKLPTGNFARLKELYEANKAHISDEAKSSFRIDVVHALGENKSHEAMTLLAEIAKSDSQWDVCQEAVTILGACGKAAEDQLIELSTWKNLPPYVKIISANSLGRIRSTAATDALVGLAKHKDALIRIAAIKALGEIAIDHDGKVGVIVPVLAAGLADEQDIVKRAAIDAVSPLAGKLAGQREVIVDALLKLAKNDNPLVAKRASEALLESFKFPPEKAHLAERRKLFVSKIFTKRGEFTTGIEGPATDARGNLYAVNFRRQGTIGKVTPKGVCSLFVELPKGSTGNGIRFNSKDEMLIADYTGHNVLKVDLTTRKISIYAHESKMNQPNDLAIADNDILFASDPNWSKNSGQIWRIDTNGKATLLDANLSTTNGIEVSPDNKTLYVNESTTRNVWAYDLTDKGEISNKRLLIKFPDFGMDGMRCDVRGNLYITRYNKGTVAVISPDGKLVREVRLIGRKPSNLAFSGPDGCTCYVTVADSRNIEVFRVKHPGRAWALRQKRRLKSNLRKTEGP